MSTQVPPSRLDSTKDFSSLVPSAFARANAAFLQANNSTDTWVRTQANNSFDKANSAGDFANASFLVANSAYAWGNHAVVGYATTTYVGTAISNLVNSAPTTLDTLNELATALGNDANFSVTITNMVGTANSFANGAFVRANASYNAQNTTASFANGAFDRANSAASFANGAFVTANSGALFANGSFVRANSAASFANGAFVTANSGAVFANGAFDRANSSYAAQNATSEIVNIAFVKANSAASFANGAFTKANNALPLTGGTLTGDLSFSGSGRRFTADFTNANILNRLLFQTSNLNSSTTVSFIPNGTGTITQIIAHTGEDAGNSNFGSIRSESGTDIRITSGKTGTAASYLPLTFYTGGSESLRIDTTGNSNFVGTLNIQSTQASTSNVSGALNVIGGVGIKGNVYTGAIRVTGSTANGITFADGTTQYTANADNITATSAASFANGSFLRANASYTAQNTTASFANAAFDRANAAYAQANTGGGGSGSDTWARTQANAAYEQANTASNTANSFTGNIAVNIDNFTGDGSTTNFTMSTAPTDANNVIINVNGVIQLKSAYTVTANSTTLTLSSAPANGAKVDAIIFKSGAVSSSSGGGTTRAQSMTMGILFGG
jgi:hypothetical protein